MKKILLLPGLMVLLNVYTPSTPAGEGAAAAEGERPVEYLRVNVDRVVIDTTELAAASATLAGSVDRLALAIDRLSTENAALSDADRQTLLQAVRSADAASVALTELSRQLPRSAQDLGERLPRALGEARASLAELSGGLQAARDSFYTIVESLPQATENTKLLVNSALDAVLLRLSIYTLVLIAILALALIGIMWFIYRQYLDPLARKLDALVGAPEHFDNMARHMQETSRNLLAMQAGATRHRNRAPRRYQAYLRGG